MPLIGRRWRYILIVTMSLAAGTAGLLVAWPRHFPGLTVRASAAYDRGDWRTAAALAGERLKTAADDRRALRVLARSAVRQGRDDVARSLYGRLGGGPAMQAEDFFLFGTLVDRTGDHETARECWEAGLGADPNHAELLHAFVGVLRKRHQPARAAAVARRLASRPGWEARGRLILGEIEYELDDPAGAAASLRLALERDPLARGAPEPPSFYRKLHARALLRAGRCEEARGALKVVLASRPDPEASWLLSRAHLQRGSAAEVADALTHSASYREEHPLEPEPAPYVGSARCSGCHSATHWSEQQSLHARTFRRGTDLASLPLPGGPLSDPARPAVTHTVARSGGEVRFETHDRDQTYRALVDYAFGSGHRGVTLVGHDEKGRMRELRLSHYADGPAWDVTTGHPPQPPPGEDFLGRFLTTDQLLSCFECHTTVARAALDRAGPQSHDRGVGCERCHGPGGNHLKAVAAKLPDLAIARPGPASGAQVVAVCAACHSPIGKQVTPANPIAVRYPGTTLTWSRCFRESGGTFDCVTCHDPHRDAETSRVHYESKCLSCHAKTAEHDRSDRSSPCPVSPSRGCLPCHMPATKTAIPHSTFTDHYIRVHSGS
jgi:tetratricopeptide (TPR) repeat protein